MTEDGYVFRKSIEKHRDYRTRKKEEGSDDNIQLEQVAMIRHGQD